MTKLSQILAVEKTVKKDVYDSVTKLYQMVQKPPLLSGIARTYTPKDEDGDRLPAESTKLQLNATDVTKDVSKALARLFDVTFARDSTNIRALADIVVNGETLVVNVPVPYLLFLEKQLTDLRTLISKLPVLDPSEDWNFDANVGAYATKPTETTRTKKIPRNHVKAPATEKHPAQVEIYYEDVIVGYWRTTKFSGALPQQRVNILINRVDTLLQAVRYARQDANSTQVHEVSVGARMLDFVFSE